MEESPSPKKNIDEQKETFSFSPDVLIIDDGAIVSKKANISYEITVYQRRRKINTTGVSTSEQEKSIDSMGSSSSSPPTTTNTTTLKKPNVKVILEIQFGTIFHPGSTLNIRLPPHQSNYIIDTGHSLFDPNNNVTEKEKESEEEIVHHVQIGKNNLFEEMSVVTIELETIKERKRKQHEKEERLKALGVNISSSSGDDNEDDKEFKYKMIGDFNYINPKSRIVTRNIGSFNIFGACCEIVAADIFNGFSAAPRVKYGKKVPYKNNTKGESDDDDEKEKEDESLVLTFPNENECLRLENVSLFQMDGQLKSRFSKAACEFNRNEIEVLLSATRLTVRRYHKLMESTLKKTT